MDLLSYIMYYGLPCGGGIVIGFLLSRAVPTVRLPDDWSFPTPSGDDLRRVIQGPNCSPLQVLEAAEIRTDLVYMAEKYKAILGRSQRIRVQAGFSVFCCAAFAYRIFRTADIFAALAFAAAVCVTFFLVRRNMVLVLEKPDIGKIEHRSDFTLYWQDVRRLLVPFFNAYVPEAEKRYKDADDSTAILAIIALIVLVASAPW